MALTSAVANAAAAAAAAGAGKKAAQVQLQAELNSDDDWNKFLQRDGLLVVDVYTEWCGPCIGMVGNLKKIKVELGGDNLHLAVAKSDTIECLKRFRKRSQPTWMFIASGQLLNVVFGADAPRLTRTIEQELKNEELAKKGELQRPTRAPHELTPPEQEVANIQEKQEMERMERERAAAEAARGARREARAARLDAHFNDICPALLMPHAQKNLRKVSDVLEANGLIIADKCPLLLGKDSAKRLALEDPELGAAAAISTLNERPALTLVIKKMPDKEGNLIELAYRALCGEQTEDGSKSGLYEELRLDGVPGLFVPADRQQRAAAMDLLFTKMVSSVVPAPPPPPPPHVAAMLGAWQRRAALGAMGPHQARLLHYGFFADDGLDEPRLLCKTLDKYEERIEKDYCETIVLMLAVGLAEPELAEPGEGVPRALPSALKALGPLHVSADAVAGQLECSKFFPPGYGDPEPRPKGRGKKKRKKRHETKEDSQETPQPETPEGGPEAEAEADAEAEAETEENGDAEDDSEESVHAADKATSPPPDTPH